MSRAAWANLMRFLIAMNVALVLVYLTRDEIPIFGTCWQIFLALVNCRTLRSFTEKK